MSVTLEKTTRTTASTKRRRLDEDPKYCDKEQEHEEFYGTCPRCREPIVRQRLTDGGYGYFCRQEPPNLLAFCNLGLPPRGWPSHYRGYLPPPRPARPGR